MPWLLWVTMGIATTCLTQSLNTWQDQASMAALGQSALQAAQEAGGLKRRAKGSYGGGVVTQDRLWLKNMYQNGTLVNGTQD